MIPECINAIKNGNISEFAEQKNAENTPNNCWIFAQDIDREEVISTLESKGFTLVKNDCEADTFFIYTLKK